MPRPRMVRPTGMAHQCPRRQLWARRTASSARRRTAAMRRAGATTARGRSVGLSNDPVFPPSSSKEFSTLQPRVVCILALRCSLFVLAAPSQGVTFGPSFESNATAAQTSKYPRALVSVHGTCISGGTSVETAHCDDFIGLERVSPRRVVDLYL